MPEYRDLTRVVVAIDPAVSAGPNSDETGIVVCGLGVDACGYVLDDLSCRLSPEAWATRVVNAYYEYQADRVLAEVNNGGDLVQAVLRTVDPRVPYKAIHAARGKYLRAEPVSSLYAQGRVFHIRRFPELEEQMCTFVPGSFDRSPDRLDALVYALTELMVVPGKRKLHAY